MTFEVICMEIWTKMHGDMLGNNEVASKQSTLPFLLECGPWAENLKEKKDFWAFWPLSPIFELVRVCFMLKRMQQDFYVFLELVLGYSCIKALNPFHSRPNMT